MKVLHVYQIYFPEDFTGIPRVIFELCESMSTIGVKSEVLCLSDNPSSTPTRVGTHIVHHARKEFRLASTSISLDIFKRFREIVDQFDLIHYHFPWPPGDLLFLSFGRTKPSVVTYHSDIVKQKILRKLYAPIQSIFLNSIDRIVSTSPNYLSSSKILAKYKSKTVVIPLGLSDRLEPNEERLKFWHDSVGKNFFLFVGALRYYKGLRFLIEAANRTGLPVVIAGRGNIDAYKIPKNVRYLPEISDVDKECLLSLCRAFVFPSHLRSEAFGVSLLEAARAGKPMISCEIGTGTSYVNIHEATGLVIRPQNVEDLSNAMCVLHTDDCTSNRLGVGALQRFKAKFQIEVVGSEYKSLYRDTISRYN